MNVWSKGLGNVSLDLDLEKATLGTRIGADRNGDRFVFSGIIESNWWEYAVSLTAEDMEGFVRLLGKPVPASLLAESGGGRLLLRFVGRFVMLGFRFSLLLLTRGGADSQRGTQAKGA